jgi:hypothetical protein
VSSAGRQDLEGAAAFAAETDHALISLAGEQYNHSKQRNNGLESSIKTIVRTFSGLALMLVIGSIWAFSLSIPALYRTSPLAWADTISLLRLGNQTDEWMESPAYFRASMRRSIELTETSLAGPSNEYLVLASNFGPPIYFLPPFQIDGAYEPVLTIESRETFASVLTCSVFHEPFQALTEFHFDGWVLNASPPEPLIARARDGDLDAQHDLGLGASYIDDHAIGDPFEQWLERAAHAEHAPSMAIVGAVLVTDPEAGPEQYARGLRYIRDASEAGNILAMDYEAVLPPRDTETLEQYARRRLDQDMISALACSRPGIARIAARLSSGRGLPRDRNLAIDLMITARYGSHPNDETPAIQTARLVPIAP